MNAVRYYARTPYFLILPAYSSAARKNNEYKQRSYKTDECLCLLLSSD